jgi:hypothetical protein
MFFQPLFSEKPLIRQYAGVEVDDGALSHIKRLKRRIRGVQLCLFAFLRLL